MLSKRAFHSDEHAGVSMLLYVDDDATNHLTMRMLLITEPQVVLLEASGGEDAVEVLESEDTWPDLILMDNTLLNETGAEAIDKIRAACGDIFPFVYCTALSEQDMLSIVASSSAQGVLCKPVQKGALLSEIKKWTGRHIAGPEAVPATPAPRPSIAQPSPPSAASARAASSGHRRGELSRSSLAQADHVRARNASGQFLSKATCVLDKLKSTHTLSGRQSISSSTRNELPCAASLHKHASGTKRPPAPGAPPARLSISEISALAPAAARLSHATAAAAHDSGESMSISALSNRLSQASSIIERMSQACISERPSRSSVVEGSLLKHRASSSPAKRSTAVAFILPIHEEASELAGSQDAEVAASAPGRPVLSSASQSAVTPVADEPPAGRPQHSDDGYRDDVHAQQHATHGRAVGVSGDVRQDCDVPTFAKSGPEDTRGMRSIPNRVSERWSTVPPIPEHDVSLPDSPHSSRFGGVSAEGVALGSECGAKDLYKSQTSGPLRSVLKSTSRNYERALSRLSVKFSADSEVLGAAGSGGDSDSIGGTDLASQLSTILSPDLSSCYSKRASALLVDQGLLSTIREAVDGNAGSLDATAVETADGTALLAWPEAGSELTEKDLARVPSIMTASLPVSEHESLVAEALEHIESRGPQAESTNEIACQGPCGLDDEVVESDSRNAQHNHIAPAEGDARSADSETFRQTASSAVYERSTCERDAPWVKFEQCDEGRPVPSNADSSSALTAMAGGACARDPQHRGSSRHWGTRLVSRKGRAEANGCAQVDAAASPHGQLVAASDTCAPELDRAQDTDVSTRLGTAPAGPCCGSPLGDHGPSGARRESASAMDSSAQTPLASGRETSLRGCIAAAPDANRSMSQLMPGVILTSVFDAVPAPSAAAGATTDTGPASTRRPHEGHAHFTPLESVAALATPNGNSEQQSKPGSRMRHEAPSTYTPQDDRLPDEGRASRVRPQAEATASNLRTALLALYGTQPTAPSQHTHESSRNHQSQHHEQERRVVGESMRRMGSGIRSKLDELCDLIQDDLRGLLDVSEGLARDVRVWERVAQGLGVHM